MHYFNHERNFNFQGRLKLIEKATIEIMEVKMDDAGWYECCLAFYDGAEETEVLRSWINLTIHCEFVMLSFVCHGIVISSFPQLSETSTTSSSSLSPVSSLTSMLSYVISSSSSIVVVTIIIITVIFIIVVFLFYKLMLMLIFISSSSPLCWCCCSWW